jgi:hypothetical protein
MGAIMAFNLDDYTTVQERSNIFWERYPDGAIRTELVEASNTRFIVVCKLFKTTTDLQPFAMGHAQEVISDRGVNRDFALENAETSSRGVAFKCANIGTEKNAPSREEMEKVKRLENKAASYSAPNTRSRAVENALRSSFNDEVKDAIDPQPVAWAIGDVVAEIGSNTPAVEECKHGAMILKQGTAKTGKPYYGYVCSAAKPDQCDARWAKITANGKWYFEGGE